MRVGLVVSCVAHAAVLGVGLLAFSDAEPFTVEPVEALPVELVRLADVTELRAGDRKAEPEPDVPPQPKPTVKAPAPEPEIAEKPAETPVKAAREPSPRPVRDVTKQPKPAESKQAAEPPPDEPKQVAAIPKPIPAAVEPAPTPEADAAQLPALAPTPPRARPKPPKTVVAQKAAEPEKRPAEPEKKKPEPKKVETPREESFDPDDIAALLNKQDARGGGDPEPAREKQSVGASKGAAEAPMTMSELAALQSRLAGCWNPPIGVREAGNLVVTIGIYLAPDGQLSASPRIVSAGGDYLSQVAAESAIRAVQICAPYDFLPPEKYTQWREINFNFNPREMLGG